MVLRRYKTTMKLVTALAALGVAGAFATAACSNQPAAPSPAPPPPTVAAPPPASVAAASPPAPAVASEPAPPQAPTDTVPADFPPECVEFASLIGKLRACDQLGGARDGLALGYNALRASWPSIPTAQRAALGSQCRIQTDSLRNAAAATCRW